MSEDLKKAQEMLRKIDKVEEETQKLFNIDDFIADVDEVHEVYVRGIGKVKYKRLTSEDVAKSRTIENPTESGYFLLYLMLSKANSAVTFEKVKKLSPKVSAKLFDAVKVLDFL